MQTHIFPLSNFVDELLLLITRDKHTFHVAVVVLNLLSLVYKSYRMKGLTACCWMMKHSQMHGNIIIT